MILQILYILYAYISTFENWGKIIDAISSRVIFSRYKIISLDRNLWFVSGAYNLKGGGTRNFSWDLTTQNFQASRIRVLCDFLWGRENNPWGDGARNFF